MMKYSHECIKYKLTLKPIPNIKVGIKYKGLEGVDWIHLSRDTEYSNEPFCSIKGDKFDQLSLLTDSKKNLGC
jgi:hypothetical protein